MLLRDFGEKAKDDCGRCDVCISRKGGVAQSKINNAKDMIIKAIEEAGGSLLISALKDIPMPRAAFSSAIEALREQGLLVIDGPLVRLCKEEGE